MEGPERDDASDDLIDDREYAAPPELVFEVWTKAEHLARWFVPDNAEMSLCEVDARPGGVIRLQNRFQDGRGVTIRGVFNEVVAPTRLSFTFTFVDSNDVPTVNEMMPEWPVGAHIVMTVELAATARGTRMTVAQRVAEPELANSPPVLRHKKLAAIGWSQTAERLVAYLERRTEWDS
ncbi:MAG: SRPBCC domain-containing protein [Polyangiaceae bacterium]|nr:SRPBCC domain-containing protein [Polyangiaceae bacterium]